MSGNAEAEKGRQRRVGGEGQGLPLFMNASRSRVSERVGMSAATAREMQKYLKWASDVTGVSWEEAQVMMLERALGDYFKKDEVWQAQKSAGAGAGKDQGPSGGEPGQARVLPAGKAGGTIVPTRGGDAPADGQLNRPGIETGPARGK